VGRVRPAKHGEGIAIARLPTRYDISQQPSGRSGRQLAEYDTSAVGRGLANFGQGIANLGAGISAANLESQKEQTLQEGIAADGGAIREMNDFTRKFDEDGDVATFGKRAEEGLKEIGSRYASRISDPKARLRWQAEYDRRAEGKRNQIADLGERRVREQRLTGAKSGLEGYQAVIADENASEEDRVKAKRDAEASVAALEQGGLLSSSEAEKWRETVIGGGDFVFGQRALEKDPEAITGKLPARVSDRAGMAMKFFQDRGWTPAQAAGIVGNLLAESSLSTDARNAGDGRDGSDSIGIGQWNSDRAKALKDFAASNGGDWKDLNVQLAFVDHELNGTESGAGSKLKSAKDVQEATEAFIMYERPAGSQNGARSAHNYNGRLKFAQQAAGETIRPDWYLSQTPENQLKLERLADAEQQRMNTQAAAQQKANQAQANDDFRLRIAVADPTLTQQDILNDARIDNGDKATLLNSWQEKMKDELSLNKAVTSFRDGTLGSAVDPYTSDGRKIVDGLEQRIIKSVPPDQQLALTDDLIRQSGIVPEQTFNAIRKGLSSQDVAEVEVAAQMAQRIATINPAALARRDSGSQVRDIADDFSYYVNSLNLSPTEAAARLAERNDPNKVRERKVLEPAAREFRKAVEKDDVADIFDDSWTSDPAVGFNAQQALGIQADYLAMAEEQFYKSGGDPELAKNRAQEEMKRLYGVTRMTGSPVVMKHPPERYWPAAQPSGLDERLLGSPFGWAKSQLGEDIYAIDPKIPHTFELSNQPDGTQKALPKIDMSKVQLIATPETDRMVKRGELPAYQVLYTDENGLLQTIPGKLWAPDFKQVTSRNQTMQDENVSRARQIQEDDQFRANMQNQDDGGRAMSQDMFLDGPPQIPIGGGQ
jgi:hypothetical protein